MMFARALSFCSVKRFALYKSHIKAINDDDDDDDDDDE